MVSPSRLRISSIVWTILLAASLSAVYALNRRATATVVAGEGGDTRFGFRLQESAKAALSSAIRFNHENQWRFQTPLPEHYRFAFDDWRIDRNGFPHSL